MPLPSITDLDNQQELSEDPKDYTSNPEDLENAKSINRILRLRAPKETAGFVGLDLRPNLGLQMGSDDFYSTNLNKVSEINIDKTTDPADPKIVFSFKNQEDAKNFLEEFEGYKTITGNPILSGVHLRKDRHTVIIPTLNNTQEKFKEITNSTAAREFRAQEAEERVYKIKDEPLKQVAAAVMNWPTLGIPVVPAALGVSGLILGNCDNLCRATGILAPLSPFFSSAAQICLRSAAMGMDRSNLLASGEESSGHKMANFFNKMEKGIQADEEKPMKYPVLRAWKAVGNVALAIPTRIVSFIANQTSIVFNGAGDLLLNTSRKVLDDIKETDKESRELNVLPNFIKTFAVALPLTILGNTFRAVGQTTRAVGQALNLPSEYLLPKDHPENGVPFFGKPVDAFGISVGLNLGIAAHNSNDHINKTRLDAAQFGAKKDEKGELIKDERSNPTFVPVLNPFAKVDHTKVPPNRESIEQQQAPNEAAAKREAQNVANLLKPKVGSNVISVDPVFQNIAQAKQGKIRSQEARGENALNTSNSVSFVPKTHREKLKKRLQQPNAEEGRH